MPEFMSSDDRRRALSAGVGLALAATTLGLAVCPGQKTSLTPELSPEFPSDPVDASKAGKAKDIRGDVRKNVRVVSDDGDDDDDDDDSTGESLPSVSIDPKIFDDGTWGLDEVSACVRAPGDVVVTYPDPKEMRVISLKEDGQPHVPASVAEDRGSREGQREMVLKVGRMKVVYELPPDDLQAEIEGRLTALCRDVRGMVHRTDWPNNLLCHGPEDTACDVYIGELQAEGSDGQRPVRMMDDLLDLLTNGDFFDEIDRYKLNAFTVEPEFSRGLGHFSVSIEHQMIDGEPTLVYSVTSTNVGGFFDFATPEEVVEFIFKHWKWR